MHENRDVDDEEARDPSETRLDRALSIAFAAQGSEGVESLAAALPGRRFEIQGELGHGAVGVVAAARDVDLDRDVAIKILRREVAERPGTVARFLEEAQIAGQLQHPGIVPVYGLGAAGGKCPFIAMKLVQGRTLADLLADRHQPADGLRRILDLFEPVCRTMAYVHAQGVLHRDLKPSNVMVGAFGEILVVDWGLAKVLGRPNRAEPVVAEMPSVRTRRFSSTGSDSVAGTVIGTPAYMPPEQAAGRVDDVDERSDVFALGAILCEILTGEPPYRPEIGEPLVLAREARLDDARQRLRKADLDEELLALCLSCLTPHREDRPPHAGAVADALGRHLARLEEQAREAELTTARETDRAETDRARAQLERRHADRERRARRRTLSLAMAVLVAVVLGLAGILVRMREEQALERRAMARVAEAMREASRFEGEAQWARATTAASEAVSAARSGQLDAGTSARAEKLLVRLQEEEQEARDAVRRAAEDAALLARIDDIVVHHPTNHDRAKMDAEYATAFRELGIDVETLEPDVAAAGIAARSAPVELAVALEEWTWLRCENVVGRDWEHLLNVVRAADPDPWRNRVRNAAARNDFDELRSLAEAADIEALPIRTLTLLAARLGLGDPPAAFELLRAAHERHPDAFHLSHDLARRVHGSRHGSDPASLEEAACYHLAALAVHPNSACDLVNLGSILNDLGDSEGAIAATQRVIELRPDYAGAYHNLGFFQQSTDPEEAERLYRWAIELDPDFGEPHNSLGVLYNEQGELDRARGAFESAIEVDPLYAVPHCNLGIVLDRLGDLDGAIASCERSIELDSKLARAHFHLGWGLARRGDLEVGLAVLRKVIELDPGFSSAHANLGVLLCDRVGDYEGAEAAFRAAIAIDPTVYRYHSNLGLALTQQGRYEEAIAAHREAITLEPGYVNAHYNLGWTLNLAGRSEEAAAAYRSAIELRPDHADYWRALGDVSFAASAYEEALEAFERAASLQGDGAAHEWFYLAMTNGKLGREEEAWSWLEKAAEWTEEHAPEDEHLNRLLERAAALLEGEER